MTLHIAAARDLSRCTALWRAARIRAVARVALVAAVGMLNAVGLPPVHSAQPDRGWIGKRVVQKHADFRLKIENQVIDPKAIEIYRVIQVNGPWLWLKAQRKGLSGWAVANQVVPVDLAVAFFTDHIRSKPGDAHGYTMRAMVWHMEQHKLDVALRDYNEAIRLDPTKAHVYFDRGRLWSDNFEYDKAIADYDKAIRFDPKHAVAFITRGDAWLEKKDFEKAIADYNEGIRLDPKNALAYHNRGFAWYSKKDYDKAIADYNEAIRLDPEDAGVFTSRSNAWSDKKDYDRAIADYNEAIRLDPKYAYAHYGRAVILFLTRQGGAESGAKMVLDIEGWRGGLSQDAVLLRYFSARRARQNDEARIVLDEAVARCDTTVWPYDVVQYLRGEIDEPKLLAAATDNGKMAAARCYLGLDMEEKGRKEEALAHFRWVNEHGTPGFIECTIALAESDRLEAKPSPAGRP